jgi:hypothetical protein
MLVSHIIKLVKRLASDIGECMPQDQRIVTMYSNYHVRVILQNRARPDSVAPCRDNLCERVADGLPLCVVDPESRKV